MIGNPDAKNRAHCTVRLFLFRLWSNFQVYTAKLQEEDISGEKLVSYANEILDDLKAADYEDTETMKIVMSVELMYENYKTKGMRNLVVEVLLDKGFPGESVFSALY